MSKIVNLFESPLLIQNLEDMLERAKRGDIVAAAVVAINEDGMPVTGYSTPEFKHVFPILGSLNYVMRKIEREQIDK